MKKYLALGLVAALIVGCGTVFTGIVTITKVRDNAMKELAQLNKQGLISADTDKKIAAADLAYRQAAEVTVKALEASKATGDTTAYIQALATTKAAVMGILDILMPMISQDKAVQYQTQLLQAKTL